MTMKYPHLFTPVEIGGMTMKNRIFSAPIGLASIDQFGHFGPDEAAFFGLRAEGGAAVVTLGESIVHTKTGLSHARQVQMDDPHVSPCLTKVADAIRHHGAVASVELSHGGSLGSPVPDENGELVMYGASADVPGTPGYPVREMPVRLIEEIADSFGRAAKVARNSGYEMVMVHAGHGWLLNQFLSPFFNHRSDEFGGSLENRARFLMMALDAVRSYCPGMPVELRMNGSDIMSGGQTLEDAVRIAKYVEDKVDLFHVSCGSFIDISFQTRTHPNQFYGQGPNVHFAAAVKEAVKKPVATVGGLNDPEQCEEILRSGKADVVEMARALLADPYFPKKAQQGREKDITLCIQCMDCSHENGVRCVQTCALNPVIGCELEVSRAKAPERKKRVLVAGGGPAGLMAAITAAKRGHDVTLCEKSGKLGGALHLAALPSFKQRILDFARVLESRAKESGVHILLNTEVTPAFAERFGADAVIAAIGAEPVRLRIPGMDSGKVVPFEQAEAAPETLGENVVIVGGSFHGCETAVSLAMQGVRNITVLEMRDELVPECGPMWIRPGIQAEFDKYGIRVRTGVSAKAVTEEGLVINTGDGEETLPADSILFCVGTKAKTAEAMALAGYSEEFQVLGDCRKAGRIQGAVRDGFFAGLYL